VTEEEWLACVNPLAMLLFLGDRGSPRQFRLLACACCRRIWDEFPDPRNRDLIVAVEDHPDGDFHDPDLHPAIVASSAREHEFVDIPAYWVAKYLGRGFYKLSAADSAYVVIRKIAPVVHPAHEEGVTVADGLLSELPARLPPSVQVETVAQAHLLRDIFGNSYRDPVSLDASVLAWHDGLIPKLARAAADHRALPAGTMDSERLGILADALEDAGCDAAILKHLRSPGPHVRGCWGLDLVLGEERKLPTTSRP
jgi:hypothetical protein